MRAEAAGDPGPWRQQAILGRGNWNAEALRDIVREYALETLSDRDAVLVIDETGFLKQGKASCGVARQYTGSAGKITNCQIGVFTTYVSRHGHAFIDRALYLPREWTDDRGRMKAAHVPDGVRICNETPDRAQNDRACDHRQGAFCFCCGGQRVWRGRYRDHAAQGWQRLCSGCCIQSRVPFLEQEAAGLEEPLRRLLKVSPRTPGGACRRAKEPKVRGCTIGPISNWPISMPANTATPSPAHGRAAC